MGERDARDRRHENCSSPVLGDVIEDESMDRRTRVVILLFLFFQVLVVMLSARGAFSDEGTYVLAGLSQLRHEDHHAGYPLWLAGTPYLFPVLAGAGYLVGGLAGSRFVAVALYGVGLVLFARFTRRLFGASASFFATLLLCGNGVFFSFAHLAVYDSAAFAAVAGCTWSLVELGRSGKTRWIAAAAGFGALAVVSKYSVVIALGPCLALPFVSARRCRWYHVAGAAIGMVALAATYMQIVYGQLIPSLTLDILKNHHREIERRYLVFSLAYVLFVPLAIAVSGAMRLARRRPGLSALALVAAVSWPLLHVLTLQQVSLHKDAIFGFVLLYPLIGVAISRWWTTLPAAAGSLVAASFVLGAAQWYVEDHSWSDVRPVADFIVPRLERGDTVAIATGWDFAMYAVAEHAIPTPQSVLDRWRAEHGANVCTARWIVGLRPDPQAINRPELVSPFAQAAEQCHFVPVASFPASYYFVWPPLLQRSPVEFVVYRRSGSG
jgi:4-amino-4-deoxy-L-arabinose transferase-like glycosyltransferase